jgi:hypothetical protein
MCGGNKVWAPASSYSGCVDASPHFVWTLRLCWLHAFFFLVSTIKDNEKMTIRLRNEASVEIDILGNCSLHVVAAGWLEARKIRFAMHDSCFVPVLLLECVRRGSKRRESHNMASAHASARDRSCALGAHPTATTLIACSTVTNVTASLSKLST